MDRHISFPSFLGLGRGTATLRATGGTLSSGVGTLTLGLNLAAVGASHSVGDGGLYVGARMAGSGGSVLAATADLTVASSYPSILDSAWGWWRADQGVYEDQAATDAAEDGDSVLRWEDINNSRVFGIGATGPELDVDALNDNPSLGATASSGSTLEGSGFDGDDLPNDVTIYIVCRNSTALGSGRHIWLGRPTAVTKWGFGYIQSTGEVHIRDESGAADRCKTSVLDTDWHAYEIQFVDDTGSSGSGDWTLRVDDGSEVTEGGFDIPSAATLDCIGDDRDIGEIAEIIIFDGAITSLQRSDIRDYLLDRYGLGS